MTERRVAMPARADISRVHVLCTVETRDREHIAEIQQRLAEHGVELSRAERPPAMT